MPSKTERRMGQITLAIALRTATDAAMIVNPHSGRPNPAAMRRVKKLLREYPEVLDKSHVAHNLSPRRIGWLRQVQERL